MSMPNVLGSPARSCYAWLQSFLIKPRAVRIAFMNFTHPHIKSLAIVNTSLKSNLVLVYIQLVKISIFLTISVSITERFPSVTQFLINYADNTPGVDLFLWLFNILIYTCMYVWMYICMYVRVYLFCFTNCFKLMDG